MLDDAILSKHQTLMLPQPTNFYSDLSLPVYQHLVQVHPHSFCDQSFCILLGSRNTTVDTCTISRLGYLYNSHSARALNSCFRERLPKLSLLTCASFEVVVGLLWTT